MQKAAHEEQCSWSLPRINLQHILVHWKFPWWIRKLLKTKPQALANPVHDRAPACLVEAEYV